MTNILRRIRRLKKKLHIVAPVSVTLTYMDGSHSVMNDDDAVEELFTRGDIKAVCCAHEGLKSFLDAMLPGCGALSPDWEDDSCMLEGVE